MANRFQPIKRGKVIEQNITMYLDDSPAAFHGWENLTVSENIDSIANGFSFQIPQRFQQTNSDFKLSPGVKVEIFVNKEPVLTGRIDRTAVSIGPNTKTVNISGRSLPADLVDCAVEGPMEYKNISLDNLARELIAPFGLKVFLSVTPKIIAKVGIKPGDTVFDIIDKQARLQGFFWLSTRGGNIRLTKGAAGEERFRADSKIEEDINMKTGSVILDDSQRFSNYTVKGQIVGTDNYPGIVASVASGTAIDEGIRRNRPLILVAEGSADTEIAKQRAQWEAASRLAKAVKINVLVQNWQQETIKLWGVNQLIRLKSRSLGIDGDFLSTTVERIRSNSEGTISRIALTRQDAYQPKPVIPKDGAGANTLEGIVAFSQRSD